MNRIDFFALIALHELVGQHVNLVKTHFVVEIGISPAHVPAQEPKVRDALLAGHVKIDRGVVFFEISNAPKCGPQNIGVVAAAQAAIRHQREHRGPLGFAIDFQQRVLDIGDLA